MGYRIQSAKITSHVTDRNWGGCLLDGNLAVFLEIESEDGVPATNLGKSVFDQLLLKKKDLDSADKQAVKSLLGEISGNPYIKTAIICLFSETDVALGCYGKGQVVLVRGEEFGTVVSGGFISSGKIAEGDRYVFHSDRLAKALAPEKLHALYLIKDSQQFEEETAAVFATLDKTFGLSVMEIAVSGVPRMFSFDRLKFGIPAGGIPAGLLKKIAGIFAGKTLRQKITISVLAFLFLILIFNISVGFIRAKNSQKLKLLEATLQNVNNQYEEAKSLIELNPVRARELLAESKLTVTSELAKSGKKSREFKILNEWFEKISSLEVNAYRIYKLTAVPVFFDVSLIKSGGIADQISSYQEEKVILDRKTQTVYYLNSETKASAIIAGSDKVKNAKSIAVHGTFAYWINDDGIYSIDLEKKDAKIVISKDQEWSDIKAVSAFAGNLYLLDSGKNSIWKYVAAENGFSEKRTYIGSGVPANLSGMDNMAIDGSVYVSGGKVLTKYTQGVLSLFEFKGLGDSIAQMDSISTSDEEKNIYILDAGLKRIVVIDKDGLYQSQYQWEDLKKATSIAATESEGKIYVLIGEKIYAIDIK